MRTSSQIRSTTCCGVSGCAKDLDRAAAAGFADDVAARAEPLRAARAIAARRSSRRASIRGMFKVGSVMVSLLAMGESFILTAAVQEGKGPRPVEVKVWRAAGVSRPVTGIAK